MKNDNINKKFVKMALKEASLKEGKFFFFLEKNQDFLGLVNFKFLTRSLVSMAPKWQFFRDLIKTSGYLSLINSFSDSGRSNLPIKKNKKQLFFIFFDGYRFYSNDQFLLIFSTFLPSKIFRQVSKILLKFLLLLKVFFIYKTKKI